MVPFFRQNFGSLFLCALWPKAFGRRFDQDVFVRTSQFHLRQQVLCVRSRFRYFQRAVPLLRHTGKNEEKNIVPHIVLCSQLCLPFDNQNLYDFIVPSSCCRVKRQVAVLQVGCSVFCPTLGQYLVRNVHRGSCRQQNSQDVNVAWQGQRNNVSIFLVFVTPS